MFYKFQKYIRYKRLARNEYSLHSPFMFDLYNAVFKKARKKNILFDPVEHQRQLLLGNHTTITITDLGAGSQHHKGNERKISELTRHTSKKPRYARFMRLLADELKCTTMVELGTSVGISTAYLAIENNTAKVYTIEGCRAIHQVAQNNFNQLGLTNVQAIQGAFDDVLPGLLADLNTFDLLYVDGNHTYEATLRYFDWALPHVHNGSVMIFDDIYWNEDMTRAWKKIMAHPSVTASVDVFELGIVFFRQELSKQDFVLKL